MNKQRKGIISYDDLKNIMVISDLHDGYLTKIEIIDDHVIELGMKNLENQQYVMVLSGVKKFYATQFNEINIILDISVDQGQDISLDNIVDMYKSIFGEYVMIDILSPQRIKVLQEEMITDNLYYVEVSSSSGCYLYGLRDLMQPAQPDCRSLYMQFAPSIYTSDGY